MHILSIDRNNSTLQISGKVAGAFVRTLETFQGTHILGASRGLLCDSSAVLSGLQAHARRYNKYECTCIIDQELAEAGQMLCITHHGSTFLRETMSDRHLENITSNRDCDSVL